ncbi:hypothetical protein SDC9_19749 [bioreactor metagenome]|uniref:Uncharacterized protein n=2 Tax=root TaxID=1 RepID=A0A0G9K0U1_9BACT|nr:hypothetical protein AA20_06525 [Aliarcobacter butzleri L348]
MKVYIYFDTFLTLQVYIITKILLFYFIMILLNRIKKVVNEIEIKKKIN